MFGKIEPPDAVKNFSPGAADYFGLPNFLNLLLKVLIVSAGIYALFNFVFAGYTFLSAGDDSKKIEAAWAKIWQSALGLAVAAGAFVLAAIFGQIIFGSWDFILNPCIPAPGATTC